MILCYFNDRNWVDWVTGRSWTRPRSRSATTTPAWRPRPGPSFLSAFQPFERSLKTVRLPVQVIRSRPSTSWSCAPKTTSSSLVLSNFLSSTVSTSPNSILKDCLITGETTRCVFFERNWHQTLTFKFLKSMQTDKLIWRVIREKQTLIF